MVDDDNYNLFDDSVFQPRKRPESNLLVIRQRKGRKLSKEQRAFNRLTKRIAELERRMTTEREKLDLLLDRYLGTVAPVEQELAQRKIEFARALATAGSGFGLRKRQKEDLREMLMDPFDEVFEVMKPDAETEALYDEWSETSYQDEIRQEAEALKRGMADALRAEYGIKMDVSGDDHSPEAMARLLHDAREKVRAAEAEMPRSRSRRRRDSKEGDHEVRQRQYEALTRKSVRDVYLSLAKVLHPDTVADAAERSLREEYMKQATFAYRQGDLAALLKLELRWVTRDDAGPNALSDETLRVYIPTSWPGRRSGCWTTTVRWCSTTTTSGAEAGAVGLRGPTSRVAGAVDYARAASASFTKSNRSCPKNRHFLALLSSRRGNNSSTAARPGVRGERPGRSRPRAAATACRCRDRQNWLLAATGFRYHVDVSRKRFEDMNCGVGQALEVFGDWWSLLIVRDAFFGLTRFRQFERSLGIAKNILAKRLEHLVDHGIFEKVEVGETGGHSEYLLTPKGEALLTVLVALREWSDEWVFGRGNEPILMIDGRTGKRVPKMKIRDAQGREVSRRHLRAVLGPGASDDTKQRLSS